MPQAMIAALLAAAAVMSSPLATLAGDVAAIRAECAAMPEDWPRLLCHKRADQHVRNSWLAARRNAVEDPARADAVAGPLMDEVDAESRAFLKKMVASRGWPRISREGEEIAVAAWLIAQHSDRDRAFQKETLARLAELYPEGEARRRDYAFLHDRVASGEKRPQRWGTQGGCAGAVWRPDPIEDESRVDVRRREYGLEPLAVYVKRNSGACR